MARKLIILANSRKKGNRCIAGIDADTGEWVRPCFGTGEQGVPRRVRLVGGMEPRLLDIVAVPLANDGPHRDIQPENRQIAPGPWERVGKAALEEVAGYCQEGRLILHNAARWIHVSQLHKVAAEDRKSLCLIQAHTAFSTERTHTGSQRVVATFAHGWSKYAIPVTDYEFEHAFPANGARECKCLLTLSLGMPFERDNCCYKFAAGIIELPSALT